MKYIQTASFAAFLAASSAAFAATAPESTPTWATSVSETAAMGIPTLAAKVTELSNSSVSEAPAILTAAIQSSKATGTDALELVSAAVDGVNRAKLDVAELTAAHQAIFAAATAALPAEADAIRSLATLTADKLETRLAVAAVIGGDNASRFVAGSANPENAGQGAGILGAGDPRLIKGPKKIVSFFIP